MPLPDMNIHRTLILTAALMAPASLQGQTFVTENHPQSVGSTAGDVPDGLGSITVSQVITGSQIQTLTGVQVSLQLGGTQPGGGWAGDLFVSLNRNLSGQSAVLLNQVGVTGDNPAGHGYDGWNVTFRDDAVNGDIHLALADPGTTVSGLWQPDGRTEPAGSERTALLDVFVGAEANGTWYLTLADLSPGGRMTLQGWTLSLTGTTATPVPEPAEIAAAAALGLAVFAMWRRRR